MPDFVKVADSSNVFKHHLKCRLFDTAFYIIIIIIIIIVISDVISDIM